jgi:hypothetical protein
LLTRALTGQALLTLSLRNASFAYRLVFLGFGEDQSSFWYTPAVNERISNGEPVNPETQKFIKEFTGELVRNYQLAWQFSQKFLLEHREDLSTSEPGCKIALQIQRRIDTWEEKCLEMENRGRILQKFPGAVAQMLQEQKELPLPEFLKSELAWVDYNHVMSTKGAVLNPQGEKIEELRSNHDYKKGGIIRIFHGYQIGVKVKYGSADPNGIIVPTLEPTSVCLLPVSLIRGKYWYDSIYLR